MGAYPQPWGMWRIFHLKGDLLAWGSRGDAWIEYVHSNMVLIHVVAHQPDGVATGPTRTEHCRVIGADDECAIRGVCQVLLQGSRLVNVVPVK